MTSASVHRTDPMAVLQDHIGRLMTAFRDMSAERNNSSSVSVFRFGDNVPRGLTPEQIGALPLRTITPERQGMNCSVCLEDYHMNESVQELPCKHIYHPTCIKTWLEDRKTCPVCRAPVVESQPENNETHPDGGNMVVFRMGRNGQAQMYLTLHHVAVSPMQINVSANRPTNRTATSAVRRSPRFANVTTRRVRNTSNGNSSTQTRQSARGQQDSSGTARQAPRMRIRFNRFHPRTPAVRTIDETIDLTVEERRVTRSMSRQMQRDARRRL